MGLWPRTWPRTSPRALRSPAVEPVLRLVGVTPVPWSPYLSFSCLLQAGPHPLPLGLVRAPRWMFMAWWRLAQPLCAKVEEPGGFSGQADFILQAAENIDKEKKKNQCEG